MTSFFDTLVRTEIHLWDALDSLLSASGAVSLAQWQALRSIGGRDGHGRVQDIRADLSITAGATSKLVDRLERDALAERRAHPSDRRSALIALTPDGRAALTTAQRIIDMELARVFEGIDTGAAADVLHQIAARLDRDAPVTA